MRKSIDLLAQNQDNVSECGDTTCLSVDFCFSEHLVSGWLLLNANSAFFQLYHGENKLIFNEMLIMSAFCQTNNLSWIFLVLAHWNKSPRIDMCIYFFSSPGHVSFCHHLASVVRRKLSHLNLFLWNPWTKLNQTWQGWSLGGSLLKLCLTFQRRRFKCDLL
jgi:hypothetical protein